MSSIGEEGEGAMLDGKPLTVYQLKMQRQGAAEVGNGGRLEMDRMLVNSVGKFGRKEEKEEEFQEFHRQRRLAEDERVRLADVALPKQEKGSSSSAPSTTAAYKVCIVSGFGNISADCFDSGL